MEEEACHVTHDGVSEDLIKGAFGRRMQEKQSLWIARGTVVAVSLVAAILALDPGSSVFQIVSFAWAGFGAAFGPLMLFCLFWKRTTLPGAVAGMVTG
ncbi:MAG: sodium:proline symporter, partial [Clostridia bacterium]|nr:sodium:proline symporter [Clostridia bacterium]